MAKVVEKHPDGTEPGPVGTLADEFPAIEIADIKAARQEALLGKTE